MDERRLQVLLSSADADVPRSPASADALLARVSEQAAARRVWRRRVRRGLAAVIIVLVTGPAVMLLLRRGGLVTSPPYQAQTPMGHVGPGSAVARSLAEVERLELEAVAHERMVARLERFEKQLKVRQRIAMAGDPGLSEIAEQRDLAAMALIYQADRLVQDQGQTEPAIALYAQAMALFPETHSAQVARQRSEALLARQERS